MTSKRFRRDPEYEILEELGRGGMGVVFRARQRSTGRQVALKVVFGALTPTRRERFMREGQTTANLHHPGIVRVHAYGELEGCPYLAYELLEECRNLDAEATGKDLDDQVRLVRDAAEALGHAHAKGVVHRDVKPANLLVDRAGTVKVADFGLALAEGVDRLTRTGELLGTPHYMPPEAFAGTGETGPTADVWSLGVILFEVVSGKLPFEGEQMLDLAVAITRGRAPRLTKVAPHAPPDLAAICARALEPEARDRYPDAAALVADLDAFLAGDPPPGIQGSRRRLLAGGIALVLLANAVVLGAVVAARAGPDRAAAGERTETAPTNQPKPAAATDPLSQARRSLLAGQPQLALTTLDDVRGKQAQRLRGLAALLCDRPQRARRDLNASGAVRVLDLDKARRKLMADSVLTTSEGSKPVLRGDPILLRKTCEGVLDLAERVLPTWGVLKPLIAGPVQDSLTAAIVVNLRFGEVPNSAQLLSICRRTIALDPDLPAAHRARMATAWVHFTVGVRDPRDKRLKENLVADPKGWAGSLVEEMRFAAYGMWFFVGPSPERLASGERCVELNHAPGYVSHFLRRMNLIFLCREYRKLALADLAAGRTKLARTRLTKALGYGRQNLKTTHEELPPNDADLMHIGLTELVAGDPGAARNLAVRIQATNLRDPLLAEIDLAEGKHDAAIRRAQPHLKPTAFVLQAALIGIHAAALQGRVEDARRDLAEIRTWIEAGNRHFNVQIEWRTLETTAALIEGKGWWPGKGR